ncbi:MAG: hypothetical protein L6275_05240, partial [Candidatus Portnoybacteria bacterium]|nr:hypothetical protein [Candidatus Portnoybacteria bacterium]
GFTKKPSFKSCFKLFVTLFLISVFSVHFFVMSAMVMIGWFLWSGVARVKPAMTKIAICGLLFFVASSYWMIPAMNRNEPIEGRFGVEHWEAFSASGRDGVNVLLNVLSLNGFWGEGEPWSKYFSWPQDYIVFWLAFSFVLIFVLIGALSGLRFRAIRSKVIFFSCLGVFAFIFSTGAAETIFKELNIWLYNNIFFWSGFRDSQKFSGFLALSYSVLAGVGLAAVIDFLNKRKLSRVNVVYSFVLLIPVLFGFLIWGGFQKQLRPVWYPENWHKAKQIIEADNSDSNVLFLPWHGYLSLGFNNNLITANPVRMFFGERAIVSRSVELGGVYDQETETGYKELDRIIKDEADLSADKTIDFFIGYSKIGYIVYFLDLEETDNLRYEFLNSAKLEKVFADESVEIYLTAID